MAGPLFRFGPLFCFARRVAGPLFCSASSARASSRASAPSFCFARRVAGPLFLPIRLGDRREPLAAQCTMETVWLNKSARCGPFDPSLKSGGPFFCFGPSSASPKSGWPPLLLGFFRRVAGPLFLLLASSEEWLAPSSYSPERETQDTTKRIPTTAPRLTDFLDSIGVDSTFPDRGQPLHKTIEMIRYGGFRWVRGGIEGLSSRGPTTVQTYPESAPANRRAVQLGTGQWRHRSRETSHRPPDSWRMQGPCWHSKGTMNPITGGSAIRESQVAAGRSVVAGRRETPARSVQGRQGRSDPQEVSRLVNQRGGRPGATTSDCSS